MRPLPETLPTDWQTTRDTLQQCARLLGNVRAALAPRQKHWFHITLFCGLNGLTTGPLAVDDQRVAIDLNFLTGEVVFRTSDGDQSVSVDGQSIQQLATWLLDRLANVGCTPTVNIEPFSAVEPLAIDVAASRDLWSIYATVDELFKRFRGGLREETGPVHLWPHHFDLAVLWFSGRLVPDTDPCDEENADEQMNFGFVPGDAAVPEPYFYITAYPTPEGFADNTLPNGAYWHTDGFVGAILPYQHWCQHEQPDAALLAFMESVYRAGKATMLGDGRRQAPPD